MGSKTSKNNKGRKPSEIPKESFYINEDVQNYDFSDFVKINSSPRGIILSFGKWCPEKGKFGIFEEIILPFDVANALSKIIVKHFEKLQDLNLIEKVGKTIPEKQVKSK